MVALKEALEEEEKEESQKIPGVFGSTGNLYSDDVRTVRIISHQLQYNFFTQLISLIAGEKKIILLYTYFEENFNTP